MVEVEMLGEDPPHTSRDERGREVAPSEIPQ